MPSISTLFYSPHKAVQFGGNGKQAAVPEDNESDASSIHTNPETQKMVSDVHQTLKDLKGKISEEQWLTLTKGANFFQAEIGRLKNTGRKWQNNADTIGTEFEYTAEQLEKKEQQLKEALEAKQRLEQQSLEQTKKLKETEERLQDEAKLDAEIERLTRESQAIQAKLNNLYG